MSTERLTNYHTHTYRCNHAVGDEEEYIQAAIQEGYTELGFSDHTPWPYPSGFCSHMRMKPEELCEYTQSIRALADRYAGKVTVRVGLECEYYSDRIDWLRDQVCENRLDYLVFGNHYFPNEEQGPYFGSGQKNAQVLALYCKGAQLALESGLFACFAHPDLFLRGQKEFGPNEQAASRELCQMANCYNIPLEYNLNGERLGAPVSGQRCYPDAKFWQIAAQEGCSVIVGEDAHDPCWLKDTAKVLSIKGQLEALGLQVVDSLKLFVFDKAGAICGMEQPKQAGEPAKQKIG